MTSCRCVADHRPGVLEPEHHHILPEALGGRSVADNLVTLCNTAHSSTHRIMREIFKRKGAFTYAEAQDLYPEPVSRYAFNLAHEGYRRFLAAHVEAPRL